MTGDLLFALLILLFGRAISRLLAGIIEGATSQSGAGRSLERGAQMVRDPVCGIFVVPGHALTAGEGDRRVYFCSEKCRTAYQTGKWDKQP